MSVTSTHPTATKVSVQTNMKCQSCLGKLRPILDGASEVSEWQADLNDPRKPVTASVDSDDPSGTLVALIEQAGFEAQPLQKDAKSTAPDTVAITPPESKFQWSTYKPLALVVAYVIGASALLCWVGQLWTWTAFMRFFMGGFFLGFAFFKLLNVSKFADAFSTYDIIAKRSRAYALAYPFIELGLGLAFMLAIAPLATNAITAVVMAVGLVGVIAAVRKQQAIQCACLGTVFNLPMSVVTIVENSVMIAMALGMIAMILM